MAFNVNNSADLLALKTEVNTDPLSLGYDLNANITDLVGIINAKNYTVNKPYVSPTKIRSTCTYGAYNNLAIDEQEWIRWMTENSGQETESLEATDDLKLQLTGSGTPTNSIWAVADRTVMVAAMTSIFEVPGSRAEVLFGYGTYISGNDWTTARDS